MADPTPYPDTGDTGVGPDRDSITIYPGAPRWVKVSGIITAIVAVLFVITGITHMTGIAGGLMAGMQGRGMHMPSGGAGGLTSSSSGHANTGGVGGPAAAAQAARTVKITTLDTMAFEPNRITVSAGETVTFVVTNSGQAVHEFTLGDAAMQQQHAQEMAQMDDGMAHNKPNSIRLQPGETKQLTWRFGDSGTLEYACHEPGHYQAGMRGQITMTLTQVPTEVQQL